jgi:Common central domain of tyrosinase
MATMRSPNDPLFYLHHAFCDKIWLAFQQKGPSFKMQFGSPTNSSLTIHTKLIPFDKPISEVMDIDTLCYRYEEPSSLRSRQRTFFPRDEFSATAERNCNCSLNTFKSPLCSCESCGSPLLLRIPPAIQNSSIVQKVDSFMTTLQEVPKIPYNISLIDGLLLKNPGPFDRNPDTWNKLHMPNLIDSEWLHHMGLRECDIRPVESFIFELYDDINQLEEFVSISNA